MVENQEFKHILTVPADGGSKAILIYQDMFKDSRFLSTLICDLDKIHPEIESERHFVIDSLRRSRKKGELLVLLITQLEQINRFPSDLRDAIVNNCVFIDENGLAEIPDH